MSDNIVMFPNRKENAPPQSKEDIINSVKETRKDYALAITESLYFLVVDRLSADGMQFRPESATNLLMLYNCIESICFRSLHLDHPFSELSDRTMNVDDPEAVIQELYNMLGYEE